MDAKTYLSTLVPDIQRREAQAGPRGLTAREQLFMLVWSLEAEISNGGFEQFYANPAGDHAAASAAALRTIGACTMATIVERANAIFTPDGPSPDGESRLEQLDALTEDQRELLLSLGAEFCADPDNLNALLAGFMRTA